MSDHPCRYDFPMPLLQPLIGLIGLLAIAWLISSNRVSIRWRPVLVGLLLQWILAFLILKTKLGQNFFDGAQSVFTALIGFAYEGARTVVGEEALGLAGGAPMLAIIVLVSVIFFSSLF